MPSLLQVGVVHVGQAFSVWVRGQAVINLRPRTATPAPLVRLTAGAEVLVAPKPRVLAASPHTGSGTSRPAAATAAAGAAPNPLQPATSILGPAAAAAAAAAAHGGSGGRGAGGTLGR